MELSSTSLPPISRSNIFSLPESSSFVSLSLSFHILLTSSLTSQILYEDDDREEFSKAQFMKYRCVRECVPQHSAEALETMYRRYLRKKPKKEEGYKLLESDDEKESENEDKVKPKSNIEDEFIEYESDMEI
jgi:hypothetical protein